MTAPDLIEALKLLADYRPRPIFVNKTQAAQMLGISRKTLNNWIDEGKIKLNDGDMVPIGEIDKFAFRKAS